MGFRTALPAAFVAIVLGCAPALAHDYTAGGLAIAHPWVPETAPGARAAAGYLEITNEGDAPDALIGVESDLPRTMLHLSEDRNGVMTMSHVTRVEIAPGETLTLAPGSYHVMFMGLTEALSEGMTIPATLAFEEAGRVAVEFHVEPRKEEAAHDH